MGKSKYIESPEKLWILFEGYKEHVKSDPFKVKDWVGKDADEIERTREKPLTMEGFECYVCENTDVSYPDLTEYFEGKNESYKNYFPISSRIRREIRRDQIEGGMAMLYSQSITARLNGLTDKSEQRVIQEQPMFDDDEESK